MWILLHGSRRTVISIPNGPSALAVKEAAWGLARYAAIAQVGHIFLHCIITNRNSSTINEAIVVPKYGVLTMIT